MYSKALKHTTSYQIFALYFYLVVLQFLSIYKSHTKQEKNSNKAQTKLNFARSSDLSRRYNVYIDIDTTI